MSVLAKICSSFGHIVTGSDNGLNGHDEKNVGDADVVVFTSAVGENNVEVSYARKIGKKVLERAEFLGEILKNYEKVFSISGTHGKTSTSGFLASIFQQKSPTLHIGGQLLNNFEVVGNRETIICESCEYRNSFHHINSDIALVLNMEFDHPDFFKDEDDYIQSFLQFAKRAKKVIVNKKIAHHFENAISFGLSEKADYYAKKIVETIHGISFDVFFDGKMLIKNVKIRSFGLHSVLNALAAIALSHQADIDKQEIKRGLFSFNGVKRRHELVGSLRVFCQKEKSSGKAYIYTDYAHHPTEVRSILRTFNRLKSKDGKIHIVYEPHTYSRTKTFLGEYADALSLADEIILTKIFAAREKNTDGFSSLSLSGEVTKSSGKIAFYFESEDFILEHLKKTVSKNDIVLFCGAGNVDKLAKRIVES